MTFSSPFLNQSHSILPSMLALPRIPQCGLVTGFPEHVKVVRSLQELQDVGNCLWQRNFNGIALPSMLASHNELPAAVQHFFETAECNFEVRFSDLGTLSRRLLRGIRAAGYPDGYPDELRTWVREMLGICSFVKQESRSSQAIARVATDWRYGQEFHLDKKDNGTNQGDRLVASSAYYGLQTQTLADADVLAYEHGSNGRELSLKPNPTVYMGPERSILIGRSGVNRGLLESLMRLSATGPRFGLVHRAPSTLDDGSVSVARRFVFHALALIRR
jgi:hypothetical protein